jgi:hypothetical protein
MMIAENAEKVISTASLEETSLLVIIRKIEAIYHFENIGYTNISCLLLLKIVIKCYFD